jgi:arylsulfatase A-like enzyme
MRQVLDRREFLKLSPYFLLSYTLPRLFASPRLSIQDSDAPNILVILFDAFSATNIPFHGYPRNTTPNLARIAERATVYHNHFAGGSWTYPGTTSLLTGVYPWTHRGLHQRGDIAPTYQEKNLFSFFEDYYRIAYTHNGIVNRLLLQFQNALDHYPPPETLYQNQQRWLYTLFANDKEVASLGWQRAAQKSKTGYASSLFFSTPYSYYQKIFSQEFVGDFPTDRPRLDDGNYFLFDEATDWIQTQILNLPQPYLAYFHLFPPHAPYAPRREHVGAFKGGTYTPIEKPRHFMHVNSTQPHLNKWRMDYDEYIHNVDSEFARLYDFMQENSLLENTLVILTSDHGEMFERGILAHGQPTFHQPIIRIPLMILEPGNPSRRDIFTPTVAVDLLPTLLHLTGRQPPDHLEGSILPPFNPDTQPPDRRIFAVDAKKNDPLKPLTRATLMMVKWPYKITYYLGYDELPDGKPIFEMFDLENDPEELHDLYSEQSALSAELAGELLQRLREKNQPYE